MRVTSKISGKVTGAQVSRCKLGHRVCVLCEVSLGNAFIKFVLFSVRLYCVYIHLYSELMLAELLNLSLGSAAVVISSVRPFQVRG